MKRKAKEHSKGVHKEGVIIVYCDKENEAKGRCQDGRIDARNTNCT
jgi:hypothetical protein